MTDVYQRWERPPLRYYEVRIYQDLFGALCFERVWGGIGTRLGGRSVDLIFPEAVPDALAAIRARRLAHGYTLRVDRNDSVYPLDCHAA